MFIYSSTDHYLQFNVETTSSSMRMEPENEMTATHPPTRVQGWQMTSKPLFSLFFPLSNTTYKTSPPWALSLANAVGVVLSLFLILMHHYIAPPPHCSPTNARGSGFCIFFILMRLWHPHHDDGCLTFWKGNLFYMYLCALHKLKEGWVKTNYCRCPNSDEVIMVIDSSLYSILYASLRIYISSMLYMPVIAGHHWRNVMY